MTHESIRAHSCLSAFSRQSRSNTLARTTSPNVSTPQASHQHAPTLFVRSWGALALGVICGAVTALVLFEDVLRNGARVTTDHVLTTAVIVIVAAAGHMWWRRLWSSAFITGLGLLLIFGSGLVYLVIASGGRNAEVMIAKRHAAQFANSERERIRPLLAIEEQRKQKTQDKLQADCVDGKKGKGHCDGLRTTLSVYTMAVKGYEAALLELGPEQEEDGSLRSTARVIVAWQVIGEAEREKAEARYVERLQLLIPYVKALLVELATIVFLGVAFGHRSSESFPRETAVPQRTVRRPTPATVPGTVPQTATVLRPNFGRTVLRSETVPLTQDEALEQLRVAVAKSGTVPQDDLPELFNVRAKSTVSRWCKDWEARGLITRTQGGRQKYLALPRRAQECG